MVSDWYVYVAQNVAGLVERTHCSQWLAAGWLLASLMVHVAYMYMYSVLHVQMCMYNSHAVCT